MEADFWLERWDQGRIGFHQAKVNSRLVDYWPSLSVSTDGAVLVPLCGKSLDMLWLHQAGYRIIGVELSGIALRSFFNDNGLAYSEETRGDTIVFTGTGEAAGITLLQADLFNLKSSDLGPISSVYDRASLIAMPPELRALYAATIARLVPSGAVGLLVGLTYEQSEMSGPPFSVSDNEVRALLSSDFLITELAHSRGPERLGNLADRGLSSMEERLYRLQRL